MKETEFELGFKKINPNISFSIECPNSPDNICKEDFSGYCYFCYRNMLSD